MTVTTESAAQAIDNTFMVTVDYARSLPEMIKAGNYGYAAEHITAENFPIVEIDKVGGVKRLSGKLEKEIILLHFNRNISSDDAIKEMNQLGLCPAVLPELLAFGETHPAVQKEFPIVALGSVWRNGDGIPLVPFLSLWFARRELFLSFFGGVWYGNVRFAAVRKES